MLNTAEKLEVLRSIQYCCKLGLLPAQVDLHRWDMLPHANRLKTWNSHFWFFLFVLHALYKLDSLAYWLTVGIPLHHAVFHALLAITANLYGYWYYILYIKYPRLFGVYLKMTFTGNEDDVDSGKARSWFRRLKECTLQDLFVMSLPYSLTVATLSTLLALVCDPSMKLLLYASLPKEHQTWITFTILLLEELRYIIVLCTVAVPVWILQVMSFDLVGSQLQPLIDRMQRARHSQHIYKSLRQIQLYVGTINLINSSLIFSFKLLSITMSVGTGYAAIAHFSDYPLFGVMYYFLFVNLTFIYIFCYGKAFKIPALFQKATQRALLVSRGRKLFRKSKIFRQQIRSIPRIGIKVGEFHLMERESTLNFMHFVLQNIVAMLVAYRNP